MKTRILSLITLFIVVLGLSNTSKANTLKDDGATVLNDISAINKIEVHGNVELYISDASADRVKVYNKYYTESALVQSKNGTLRITNYKAEKLVVWVSANDLRSISVFDNSAVKSFGKLASVEFEADLHDNAVADLDLNTFTAIVTVKDHAAVQLKGAADELNLSKDLQSNVKNQDFAVNHLAENKVAIAAEPADEIIGL